MAKWIAAVVAGLAAIGTALTWGASGMDYVYTAPKAEALKKEIEEHHNQDLVAVYGMLAEQAKQTRVQQNQEKLKDYERDLIGGRYNNPDEKEFIILEIKDLKTAIRCDVDGICVK